MPPHGTLYGVGCGLDRRLSIGKGEINKSHLERVPFFDGEEGRAARRVWAGGSHTLVLTDAGLYAFGYNEEGQLGVGCFGPVVAPTAIPFFKPDEVADVSIGGYHTLVLGTDGTAYSFGGNANGQLGLSSDDNAKHPKRIDNLAGVKKLSAGAQHSLAWAEDGVYSWGLGDNGQLGYTGDSFSEMLAKQQRIKAIVAENAKMAQLKGCMPGEIDPLQRQQPLESGEYNPRLHPAHRAQEGQRKNFFNPFCQRSPQRLGSIDAASVLDISAGYSTSVVLTTGGALVFGARPGVVRETLDDATPSLEQPPQGLRFVQLLGLRDLRVALCRPDGGADGGPLTLWSKTEDAGYRQVEGGAALPPGTTLCGTERTVAVRVGGGRQVLTFGEDFFGQLGHSVQAEPDDDTALCPLAPCCLPGARDPAPPVDVVDVACGWRHVLVLLRQAEAGGEAAEGCAPTCEP